MTEWLLSAYDNDKLLKTIALFLAWIAQPIQHFGNVAWSVEKPMPSGVLLRQCGQGAVLLACCLSSAQHVGEVPVVQGTHL